MLLKRFRHFAKDCDASFPGTPHAPQRHIGQVVCESRYSDVAPSEGGEVSQRLLSEANVPNRGSQKKICF